MKKRLFDLSVQEFTYLLLDFEKVYEIEVKLISDDNSPLAVYDIMETGEVDYEKSDKVDLVKGTYSQLYSLSAGFPEMRRWIVKNLFDYDMPLESIDVYNYLEYKTGGFNEDKIKVILNDMEMYYTLEYRDEMHCRACEKYIREGKAIPKIKINSKLTRYQDEYLDDVDAMIKDMLGPGAEFFYHMAIGLLKSKIKSRTSLDRQNATTLKPELGIPSQLLPIFERGQKAGFLDDEYKPIPKSMTRPQQKRFALLACIEAGLDNYCNRFGKLWGCDYNGVDESRGAVYKRAAIDSLFAQDIINKAKLK